jgi:hypothetical protein
LLFSLVSWIIFSIPFHGVRNPWRLKAGVRKLGRVGAKTAEPLEENIGEGVGWFMA